MRAKENWKQLDSEYQTLLELYRAQNNQSKIADTLNYIGVNYANENERVKAREFYGQALDAYRALKSRRDEAQVFWNIGVNEAVMHETEKAFAAYNQSEKIYREDDDSVQLAEVLERKVSLYKFNGEYDKAFAVFEEIPPLYVALKNEKGEAEVFNRIGVLLDDAYEKSEKKTETAAKAVNYYNRAMEIFRRLGERTAEAHTLKNLGAHYFRAKDFAKSAEIFEKVLPVLRELKMRAEEAEAFREIGAAYGELNQTEKALAAHRQSIELHTALDDAVELGLDYDTLGVFYQDRNDLKNALVNFRFALLVTRQGGDKENLQALLRNYGKLLNSLKDKQGALSIFEESLALARELKDDGEQGNLLDYIGTIYQSLGEKTKATESFKQAMEVADKTNDKKLVASLALSMGILLTSDEPSEDDLKLALKLFQAALEASRKIESRYGEVNALQGVAFVYFLKQDYAASLDWMKQTLPAIETLDDASFKASLFANLMMAFNKNRQYQSAIFYGKQAINLYQQMRANLKGTDENLQKGFVKSAESTYRKLADLLISDGRIPEAQAVLDLLKDEELGKILQRSGEPQYVLPYSKAETEAMTLIDRLAASGKEIADLKANKKTRDLTTAETERLNQLETTEIPAANNALRVAMKSLAVAAPDAEKTMQARMKDNVQNILPDLGGNVAALYTVFGQAGLTEKDKTNVGWILLVTPEFRKAYPIDTNNLNETVSKFRDVLRSPQYDPQPLAQELYKKLFLQTSDKQKTTLAADLDTYFAKSKDRTLMWSLDGVLRYVPMAALHDGSGYLVEKYRNVVFNTASLGSLKDATKPNWEVLGFGVSEAKTVTNDDGQTMSFAALTGAESELKSLVKNGGANASAILPGTIKLNKDFTKQALISGVREGKPVVHIASHFAFNTANEESSFLLLGDGGKLEMSEFEDFPNLFAGVDLLSLSACDTATGGAANSKTDGANGKEVEGFAYVAQTLGAKSVMASLWQVSDEGTKELMLKFYDNRQKNPQMPKGEALREAQMTLLTGKLQTAADADANRRSKTVNAGAKIDAQIPFKKDPEKPFAHPFYWSPFILFGNWQ